MKKAMINIALAFCLVFFPATLLAQMSQNPGHPSESVLDVTPIRDLLHLINTIFEENPDYEATLSGLAALDRSAREDSLAALVANNRSNPQRP